MINKIGGLKIPTCSFHYHYFIFIKEVRTLDLSAGENSDITCGGHAVIRIDSVTVHAHENYCATNMSDACVLSGDDLKSIETLCNDYHTCTVDHPKNTSCLKQDRYFNFSYSCLGKYIVYESLSETYLFR